MYYSNNRDGSLQIVVRYVDDVTDDDDESMGGLTLEGSLQIRTVV